ncbi:MAG: gamma carbonic anhydrase family protein [Hoeflea sp.]|uniref:gamma carbonic anhydrase family protein n=1 Tax=Hoeflea sp. TaxID=1940281 RepID=UPI0032999DBA|tara:strand:- start:20864 stop:21391 length:528 start_codon:yes stop_codon:yes gene_type:complete
MAIYSLDGKEPTIPDGFHFVAESAQVIGRVILEEGAGIWFGAVLRGDNEPITIGQGSNIQENCVLHTDPGYPLTIGKGCTIGHSAILHGCTIGNNSLVGMGATVLNGAKIGENCLIGAGALVTEGKVIPDNSLVVGAPARVVRTLDAGSADMLKLSASHYVKNAKRFAAGLKRIS